MHINCRICGARPKEASFIWFYKYGFGIWLNKFLFGIGHDTRSPYRTRKIEMEKEIK